MSNADTCKFLSETAEKFKKNWDGNYFQNDGPLLTAQPCQKCQNERTQQANAYAYGLKNGEIKVRVDLPNMIDYWTAKTPEEVFDWIMGLQKNYR